MERDVEEALASPPPPKLRNRLPIIAFTNENLKSRAGTGGQSWSSTCRAVREAMEEFGSFVAVCDELLGSDSELTAAAVFSSPKEFFDLPEETKLLNTSEVPGFGYYGETPHCLNESMSFEDSTTMDAVRSFANLMWPLGNHDFCEKIHGYATEVSKLEQTVIRMIFEGYGVGKHYCDSHIDSTSYLLRANKYRVPKANEATNVGIVVPHTDTSFVTIVKQDEVEGLEVQYSKDGTWIPVNFPPSSFVVIAGDALLAWSNGRIRPCFHRIIMGEKARMSVGLFSFHKGIIKVPEELAVAGAGAGAGASNNGLLHFNSFDHLGLLKFRARNAALSAEERVNAYCGAREKHHL